MKKAQETKELIKRVKMSSQLSKDEKMRILEDIKNGKTFDFHSGYPSIDRPWIKYYDKENYQKSFPKRTVYYEIYENNKEHQSDIALEFFGNKITYRRLFKKINDTAKSLREFGVKKGDFVTICLAGIPETVYMFYALSKIGAVANMISPFFNQADLGNRIEDCKSDILVIMDKFYPSLKETIKKTRIKHIVIVPTLNSSMIKVLNRQKKLLEPNEIYWKNFIRKGKNHKDVDAIPYEKKLPLAMVYSSGTTGASKGILLSNDSFQNSIQAYPASGVDLSRRQKFYQIIPPWFSTGLSTSIHLPLSYGVAVFMDPRFERNVFVRNVLKAKPNYAVAPTSMYEGFLDSKLIKKRKLDFFNYPFEGGEPLKEEVQEKIETVFKEHGSNALLRTAYGQCECGAAITTQTQKITTGKTSTGIPLPGINIKVVDDNFKELKYFQRGQILANTPCSMLEYYKNPEATKKYFMIDSSKNKWSCTGDIGYIDEDGNLYVQGRASDFSIINEEKIYNFDIENVIMMDSSIKMCDVLSKIEEGTQRLVAHIVFDDDYISNYKDLTKKLKGLQKLTYKQFKNIHYVPSVFKVRDSFPYAKSGKRDTVALMAEKEGFIFIDNNYLSKKSEIKNK